MRYALWQTLNSEQYERLADCRSIKEDIVPIAKCFIKERGQDPEEALANALDQLDANGCYFDLPRDDYDDMIYILTQFATSNAREER